MGKKNILDTPSLIQTVPVRVCFYCNQPIASKAKVCHHCGYRQTRVFNLFRFTNLISIGLLLAALWQSYEARRQSTNATEANTKAKSALVKVLQVRKDVIDISKAVIEVANIIGARSCFLH